MGAHKSFQEILDEQLQEPNPVMPPEKKTEPLTTRYEFDFSFLSQTPFTSTRKTNPYPRNLTPKAAPAKPKTKDRRIETSKLSSAEMMALKAFDLQVTDYLSRNELKSKYRALVRKYHPDHHPMGLNESERRQLTEKFHLILEAYELLDEAFARAQA